MQNMKQAESKKYLKVPTPTEGLFVDDIPEILYMRKAEKQSHLESKTSLLNTEGSIEQIRRPEK